MAMARVSTQNYVASLPMTGLPGNINHRSVTTAQTETFPAGAWRMVMTTDADIWFNPNGTAVVPSGNVVDGTGSAFLQKGQSRIFEVSPGGTISVISASGTAHVSFEYSAA